MTNQTANHTFQRHHEKEPYIKPELVTQEPLRDITACFVDYNCDV